MSFVFSKNKEKRSRSSTGESNSSFVKNVTSRVYGLLPATITKWFSSPSSSSGNGSVPITDGTDSSTEDEAPESPIMMQPPAKRFRYSSPGKYAQLTTSETTLTSNVITEAASVLYNSISSPPGRHTFRRETNFVSTPIRSHTEDTTVERSDRESFKSQHTVSAIGQSIASKRKSLFDSPASREASLNACAKTTTNTVKDLKQPYFKPHLLGSPFYPGRTMYGGASASSTYINQPNIKRRKMTCVNESKDSDSFNLSTSARQVMDILENYSSPLIEAKRIPRYEQLNNMDINNISMSSGALRSGYSYKRQELYLPSQASIMRLRARSRLMDSTKAARQIVASHSSTSFPNYTPANATNDKESGQAKSQSKLKSRLTRQNRGDDAFTMPETVQLPTAVLEIDKDNLPKFTLNPTMNPVTTSTPLSSKISFNKLPDKQRYEIFKFSNPLQILPETKNSIGSPPPPFEFNSPDFEKITTSPNNTEKKVLKVPNDWKCSDCWVSNKADAQKCICCGATQLPSQNSIENTSKCSICKHVKPKLNSEKCAICDTTPTLTSTNTLVTKAVSSKWTCDDCWVSNEESEEKCVCCGRRNPKKGSASPISNNKETAEKDWRCVDCLITNKPSVEKCAACGGAKPGQVDKTVAKAAVPPVSAASNLFNSPDSKLKEIIKSQKANWECRVCFASNPSDKSMCACCDAEREVSSNVAPKYKNFKFSTTPNPGFKFGIDPVVQKLNIAKKVEETPKPKNTQESEANNNIVPEIPNYTLTLPTKRVGDKVEGPKTDESPKPSFSFGIPNQNATPAATGFVPLNQQSISKLPDIVTPVEDKQKEKAQEVPTISFKLPESAKPPTGLFGSFTPASKSNASQNAQNTLSTSFLNNLADKNKAQPDNSLLQSAPLEKSTPQFSFSAVPAKPTTTLFGPVSTVATTGNSLTGQSDPVTTTAPIMSMFQKPEAGSASIPSFFPKSDSTNAATISLFSSHTVAAPATTPAAPMFSFCNNQSTPAASTALAADPPKKFNFSFGGSSTPTFGATPQSTASTFSLPTNPLGSNGLSNNPLENTIGGNGMTGNLLSSTPSCGNASGNTLLSTGTGSSIYNSPPKEQMWPITSDQSNPNPFMSNATPKPAFSFGSSTSSPFGGAQTGSAIQPVMFGASVPPAQNMFGQSGNQAPMFGSGAQSQPAPMFGSPQPANPAPPMGMFGAPSAAPFGAPAASLPAFEAPSLAPADTFNFGVQPSQSVFGFGQVPTQPAQSQMSGMCSFGGAASPAPVTFNMGMGNAPSSTAGRRMRKAVRRNPQR